VGGCRLCACLRRLLVLGKNLNEWGQGKARMVLVEFLAVVRHCGVDVEGQVVGADSIVGEE